MKVRKCWQKGKKTVVKRKRIKYKMWRAGMEGNLAAECGPNTRQNAGGVRIGQNTLAGRPGGVPTARRKKEFF